MVVRWIVFVSKMSPSVGEVFRLLVEVVSPLFFFLEVEVEVLDVVGFIEMVRHMVCCFNLYTV